MRICKGCNISKSFDSFYFQHGKPKGKCKVCISIAGKQKYVKKPPTLYQIVTERECVKCKIIKPLNRDNFQDFFNKNTNKVYFKKKCRECEKLQCQKYHNDNKAIILNRKHQYYIDNIVKEKERAVAYSKTAKGKKSARQRSNKTYHKLKNTDKFKTRRRERKKNRLKNDPVYKMRTLVSGHIRSALKKGGNAKYGKATFDHLDYTGIMLVAHLESQFDEHMSWENHGKYWHLDHIIPQSDLPYTSMEDENFKTCWALENLRPLEAKRNLIEGVRRTRHKKK